MIISEVIKQLEAVAPPYLQESYDNTGLIVGDKTKICTGIIVSLDCLEHVVQEAVDKGCNMIVSHHPIVFNGLKTITGKNYVERTIIAAIKNDIAIYAIHTNLDNVENGVNKKMANQIGLQNTRILLPKKNLLKKIVVFVPLAERDDLAAAMHGAGAGNIGDYHNCSFSGNGEGKFTPGEGTDPTIGNVGVGETVAESRLEMIYPVWKEANVIAAMKEQHSYEVVAHDIYDLKNDFEEMGSGLVGELPAPIETSVFLNLLKDVFKLSYMRHTSICHTHITKVALCGGAGSFLIQDAIASQSDIYISSDFKYHEFFDADGKLIIADIGHFESEQFTIDLLFDFLRQKFTTFAVLKTAVVTNPVIYS